MQVIASIGSSSIWKKIFTLILNECTEYQVVFPIGKIDEENPLIGGKEFFTNLPKVSVVSSNMMADSSMFYGELNDEIRKQFFHFLEPTFIGNKSKLWHFSLLKNEKIYLTCSDFSVCLIEDYEDLRFLLESQGFEYNKIGDC